MNPLPKMTVPLIGERHPANKAVIELLEKQLAEARKGRMLGVVVVTSEGQANFGCQHTGAAPCELMAGADLARQLIMSSLIKQNQH